MKTIEFKCVGRKAFLLTEKHSDAVRDAFSFVAPGARYTYKFKQWLQEKALGIPEDQRQGWDGKIHMMKNGTIDVGLLLGAEDDLAKAGFEVKIKKWLDRPYMPYAKKGFEEKDPKYHYQNDAVHKMLAAIKNGGGLVLAATGVGKTKTAAQFFSWIEGPCLFIVDEVPLMYQSQKELQEWLSKEGYDQKVGVVGAGEFKPERITVCTIQTLHKRAGRSIVQKWLQTIDVILIDEIHSQMARRNFGVVYKAKNCQAVFGLTATMQLSKKPKRFKCYAICGPVVFEFPMHKGVEAGVLSQGVVIQVPVAVNYEAREFKIVKGKKKEVDDYMHQVVNNRNLYLTARNLTEECLEKDLCVAVLIDRIKAVKRMARVLAAHDPKLFYGEIKVATRKKQLKAFDKGKDNLIVANRVFTKGINVKRIDVVIDAAQKSSRDDCIQKFGRAVRLHAEKAGILYFDLFTDSKAQIKAAKSRKGAFKKHKIPIKVLTTDFTKTAPWSPKELISEADILLRSALKNNKAKAAQGKLFA